uniref:NADH-ubiquinone oxidoreductase chain 3 n=1 Tax=Linevichella vortex TaxID=686705 RepID=A0A1L5BWC3_9CRUS|nr:NADH dehydrogenase subunit 3 [Linevichella vortex]
MYIILTLTVFAIALSTLLTSLPLSFAKKSLMSREKLSPFECGFDPYKKARTPFSLRFFMITILFLVFDVELTLLMPLGVLTKHSDPSTIMFAAAFLVLIILAGLLHEWNQGALAWST